MVEGPVPEALEVIMSQDALEIAVHAQLGAEGLTVNEPEPAALLK